MGLRRLNFLLDDPWHKENDGLNRARWFGHTPTGQLGASLIEYLRATQG